MLSVPAAGRDGALQDYVDGLLASWAEGRPDLDVPLVESGESGLIIANPEGRPIHFSPQARRLLFLAQHPQVTPGGDAPEERHRSRPRLAA